MQRGAIGVAFVCLGIDQLTKALVLGEGMSFAVNRGVSFGFLQEIVAVPSLVFLTFLLVVLLWLRALRVGERREAWAGALLVGGGLSNLLDRIWHGGVVDFLSLGERLHFNLADLAMVGASVFLVMGVVSERKEGKKLQVSSILAIEK